MLGGASLFYGERGTGMDYFIKERVSPWKEAGGRGKGRSSLLGAEAGRNKEPSPGVYVWYAPPVFHLYPASISPYPWYPVYPCLVSILYLSILQQIHCIPLYPTISSYIRTYLAVSSCIPLYHTVSHRFENGI